MPPTAELLALARAAAMKHALDRTFSVSSVTYAGTALVCAVVEQESAWDTHAIRYEPAFRTRYVAPLGLPPTEEIARSISWGLLQVMGQVAREHGFSGKFLSALCEPAAGLDIGCAVLASKLALARSHPLDGIPNPAPTGLVGDGGEARLPARQGSAFDSGAESQQQIPRTASHAPAGAGEIQTACDSARVRSSDSGGVHRTPETGDDTVWEAGRLEGQGITLTEDEVARALQLWNGGANPDYAAQVLARLAHYR